jgi:hypothetical protein
MAKLEQTQAQMEEKQMQLDGKGFDVLLSATNNVVVLVDLKTMIMSFIGKTINLILTTTPFDPKSILEEQQAHVTKSLVVEPTLNVGGGLVLFINDGAHFTMDFSVNGGGENIETHSKGKGDGIAKDGLGTSKQCQTTQGKKKGLVTPNPKVLADVAKLWNELTNGLGSSNSTTKANVTLIV